MSVLDGKSKLFIGLITCGGLAVLSYALLHREMLQYSHFIAFLLVTLMASRLKLSLPGVNGSMSMNLPFILISMVELTFLQTLIVACSSTLFQCLWNRRQRADAVKLIFNTCTMALAVLLTYVTFNHASPGHIAENSPLRMALATVAFWIGNTVPVALIIYLTEHGKLMKLWRDIVRLSFPYYVASAGMASMILTFHQFAGWGAMLVLLPIVVMTYWSFQMYFDLTLDPQTGSRLAMASHKAPVSDFTLAESK